MHKIYTQKCRKIQQKCDKTYSKKIKGALFGPLYGYHISAYALEVIIYAECGKGERITVENSTAFIAYAIL